MQGEATEGEVGCGEATKARQLKAQGRQLTAHRSQGRVGDAMKIARGIYLHPARAAGVRTSEDIVAEGR